MEYPRPFNERIVAHGTSLFDEPNRPVKASHQASPTGPASPRCSVCAPGEDASILPQTTQQEVPMEPRDDEPRKAPEPRKEENKHRFQIIKLEERIAPGALGCGGHAQGHRHCK